MRIIRFVPLTLMFLFLATDTLAQDRINREIAETLLLYQRDNGAWPKNYPWRGVDDQKKKELLSQKQQNDTTIDNSATRKEIQYLARAYAAFNDDRYRQAALAGITFLLEAQYANGGWPQYYPKATGYHKHITFNDNAMIGVMSLLQDIAQGKPEFVFVDEKTREQSAKAVQKGIDCILKCQVIVKGKKTVWCAQHDETTLVPRMARSYELASLSGAESVNIVRFLMDIEAPTPEVIDAIESAVAWFDQVKIEGIKIDRVRDASAPTGWDRVVVADASASPLWARFYEIETNRPFFCSRDGIPKYKLSEISHERRNGYSWLGNYPGSLLNEAYPAWQKKHALTHRTTPAFPGAEGYGRFARGGRGGDVYHVTNLHDAGPGSLRHGIESADGPRTIVFDLSGTIPLKSKLVVQKSGITIAGQTAPGDGITLKDQCLNLNNASDIIIRYIRVRLGDKNKPEGDSPDCITIDYSSHVILDHVSSSWGIDGNQDIRGCAYYTLQWSIMSEALNDSVHSKGAHAMCGSFRNPKSNISIHHNIFATSRDRHPTLGSGGKTDEFLGHIVDFRNNVIYNWTKGGTTNFCDNTVVAVNNVWRPGPESDPTVQPISIKGDHAAAANGTMGGNVFEGNPEWTRDNYAALNFERWRESYAYRGTLADWKRPMPDQGANVPLTQPAMEAMTLVLKQAGASLSRDAVDKRLIKNVRQRTGKLIDSQDEVGAWPELKSKPAPQDTDQDGMPDAWEQANRLDPKNPADRNGDADNDGYTNLEEYMNSLCPQKDALTDNLELLNQWGEQPADIQRLYAAAFRVLSARPDATFSHVAADSEVQRLCADQGIVMGHAAFVFPDPADSSSTNSRPGAWEAGKVLL